MIVCTDATKILDEMEDKAKTSLFGGTKEALEPATTSPSLATTQDLASMVVSLNPTRAEGHQDEILSLATEVAYCSARNNLIVAPRAKIQVPIVSSPVSFHLPFLQPTDKTDP